jgi:dTDP-4-dehydrorhamnose reductase
MGIDSIPLQDTQLAGQRILVTGAGGQLGTYLVQAIADAGGVPVGFGHHPGPTVDTVVDIADDDAIARAITDAAPDAVIHAAAMTDVDGCERDPRQADLINHLGTMNVARATALIGAYLVAVSTDFVFPGTDPPYDEDAIPDPISVYGASKRAGEVAVLEASDSFAIARTAWVYGGRGKHFPRTVLGLLAARPEIEVVNDERGNPTFAGDLARALVSLTALRLPGITHLTNEGTTSRFALAQEVASRAGLDPQRVRPTTAAAFLEKYPLPARRPADSSLRNVRAASHHVTLRPWQDALAEYMPHLTSEFAPSPATSDTPSATP